jgi:uncharacterized protein
MRMTDFLKAGPERPIARLILAHGAGAAMDSVFMEQITALLSERGIATLRFEFPYMAARRSSGSKRPAPKAETLLDGYRAMISAAVAEDTTIPLFIGGKSMGGRIASMLADEQWRSGTIAGLVCLGYPFHPPNQPQTWRMSHLVPMRCPALLVQGERDPFGSRTEIESLVPAAQPSAQVTVVWMPDGDHDFGPRGASGFTRKSNLAAAANAVAAFVPNRTART